MTTAPVTVSVTSRQTAAVLASPLSVLMLVAKEATKDQVTEVVPAVNTIATVDDSSPAAVLGVNTKASKVYEEIEAKSNVHVAVIPFDDRNHQANGPVALNALLSSEQRDKLYQVSPYGVDVVLVYDYGSRLEGANAIISRLETVCADPKVDAMWIADSYLAGDPLTSTQAQALAWATANGNRQDGLAVTNGGDVGGNFEFGSVITAAHICQYAAQRGIGVQPFNLSDPLTGVGTPAPRRAFDAHDGSASAEVLDNAGLTSLITYDGIDYIFGGKTSYPDTDARQWWGNAVVVKRIRKRGAQLLVPYYRVRATESKLAAMRLVAEESLAAEFGGQIRGLTVGSAVLSGKRARLPGQVFFHGFVEGVDFNLTIAVESP